MAPKTVQSRIEPTPLREIDADDRCLSIAPSWRTVEALGVSIGRHGVLTPLTLRRRHGKKLQIVRGFGRFQAARFLKLKSVPAVVVESDDLKALFLQALEDNLTTRPLSELEKARALAKLRFEFGVDEGLLIDDFQPRLGLRADRRTLRRCLALAALPEALLKAVEKGGLESDLALKLSRRPSAWQDFTVEVIKRYRLGRNKQKEFLELFDDLCSIVGADEADPRQLWQETGAAERDQRQGLSPGDRWNAVIGALRRSRFPHLSAHRERFRRLIDSLRLPPGLRIEVPRNFEGGHLTITVSIESSQQLALQAAQLERISRSEQLLDIFGLL